MIYKSSKVFFILFLFYIGWFQKVFFQIPLMPLFLGMGMIILLLLYKLSTSKKISLVITKPLFIWLLFSFYLLLTGLFVAYNKSHLIDSLGTYIQALAMMIFIINISVIDKSNNFFVKSYLVFSLLYMFTMLLYGYDEPSGRLYLSKNSNPNGDGLILLMGTFSLLLLLDSKKLTRLIISLGLTGLFFYTILLTGSRKSLIAVLLLILIWFIAIFKEYWKNYTPSKKLLSILIIILSFTLGIYGFIDVASESVAYERIIEKGINISDDKLRSGMYDEALQIFIENPIYGIGFDHFRIISSYNTYSHSTYSEIISTTGILGTLLYFSSYLIIINNLFIIYFKTKGTKSSIKALQYLILMFIMLILGTGVIHFYGIIDSIMFALMISFYYTEKMKLTQNNIYEEN